MSKKSSIDRMFCVYADHYLSADIWSQIFFKYKGKTYIFIEAFVV